ncbi:MAG TPA: CesT family type III secretion system chaperone [Noviherbaspirillum sp.]|nr:CesT family type III secretion system chaperone [Noviherbaspirillum sp.]
MPIKLYRALIDQICVQCDIKNPESLYETATNLHLNETNFSLYYGGNIDPFSALVYADFGALPVDYPKTVLLRLLETNMYMFGVNSPSFTYNPDNQHILLMFRVPLANASADSVLEILAGISNIAVAWRKDYYLLDDERQDAGLSRDRLKGTADRLKARLSPAAAPSDKNK